MNKSLKDRLVQIKILDKDDLLIVDYSLFAKETEILDYLASLMIEKSVIIQLKTKGVAPKEIIRVGKKIKNLCAQFDSIFILEGRADIALELEADGIFLDKDDIPVSLANEILGENIILGGSFEVIDCENNLFDYFCTEEKISSDIKKPVFIYKSTENCFVKLYCKL